MRNQFRMFRRGNGWFYSEDALTGEQKSFQTRDRKEASALLSVKNEAHEGALFNRAMAQAYLDRSHSYLLIRTWANVLKSLMEGIKDNKRMVVYWSRVEGSQPFSVLKAVRLFDTEPSHFWKVLRHPTARASTKSWLRQLRNYALGLGWLLHPILPKRAWPKNQPKPRRAITQEQHGRLIAAENETERCSYYQALWVTGGAQTDVASFHYDSINASAKMFCYQRKKMKARNAGHCFVSMGKGFQDLLQQVPVEGWFFPKIRLETSSTRAAQFKRLCRQLSIQDVTLHSYRYAWAQRAQWAGMPLHEAMAHLGHSRMGKHLGYAKNGPTVTLPLEYYEQRKTMVLQKAQDPEINV